MFEIKLSEYLDIPVESFDTSGVFDPILTTDSHFFINVKLLAKSDLPEFQNSIETIKKNFSGIALLLKSYIKTQNEIFRKRALKSFDFPEVEGLCIGYSEGSTSGSGMGTILRNNILDTATAMIEVGVEDPEIFEVMGLFESKIGPDRLSDMLAGILKEHIECYTKRMYLELKIIPENYPKLKFENDLLINEFNNEPVLLLPQTILHELPIAKEWEDIDKVCKEINEIREAMNSLVGITWRDLGTTAKKEWLKKLLISNPQILRDLLDDYKAFDVDNYDFSKDPTGENRWIYDVKNILDQNPLDFNISDHTKDELFDKTKMVCEKFKDLIEYNGLNEVLYDKDWKPRKEKIAQKVFQAVAFIYGSHNNIDVSPESNAGRGPVDFKFSRGWTGKVVVEMKLTTNSNLIHGYLKQVEEYKKAEDAYRSIYLVLDNGGTTGRIDRLFKIYEQNQNDLNSNAPLLIFIDAKKKESASKC